jgi:hypothetical protein
MIVYDIEIIKAVPQKDVPPESGIEYCQGWQDHENMGVSVIGAYDSFADRYRVFTKDNWHEFVALIYSSTLIAGFNSIPFDNAVLKACDIVDIWEEKSYDLLREIWMGAGLGPEFEFPSHAGYSLDAVAKANGLSKKTGNGATAPIDWQKGNIGTVIDYCLQDVAIAAKLIKKVQDSGELICPKTGEILTIRRPYEAIARSNSSI